MYKLESKHLFGMFVILVVAGLQLYAWKSGLNGTVFAFTSFIIGAISGKLLNFMQKKL